MGMKTYRKRNHHVRIIRRDENTAVIKDYSTGWEWEASAGYARILDALDGKTPPGRIACGYSREEVAEALGQFRELGWTRTEKRAKANGLGSVSVRFLAIGSESRCKNTARFLNLLLMSSFLPVFLAGAYVFSQGLYQDAGSDPGVLAGYLAGLLTGMVFHEAAHACSCLGYGGHVFEIGVMSHWFMPAAYAEIDYEDVKNRFRRCQICGAGVESNLLLAGCYLLLLKSGLFGADMLIVAAGINIIMALSNILLADGLDGMNLFQELLGVDELVETAISVVKNKKDKRELWKRGANGRGVAVCCYIIGAYQLTLPVLLGLYVVGFIIWFAG